MADWTALTFPLNSLLTSTIMTQLQANLTALMEKASGAPVLANDYVTEAMVAEDAVNQLAIKNGAASAGGTLTPTTGVNMQGSEYQFFPDIYVENQSLVHFTGYGVDENDYIARWGFYNASGAASLDYDMHYRYITASDEPFIFALRDKQTGEIKHYFIGDDPPPEYWGLDEPPEDFKWPILPDKGTENLEPLIRFKLPEGFLPELRDRRKKDKRPIHKILTDRFDWNDTQRLFVPRVAGG